jgi:predicted amidohydrolase YtcJ
LNSSANPLWGIEVAVTHKAPESDQNAWMPDQRITVEQAIEFYTKGSAYVNFLDETGTLEVGKYADIVVLDTNILAVEPQLIHTTKVLATFIDGIMVFKSNDFE